MIYTPRKHQQDAMNFHINSRMPGTLLWHGMGCIAGDAIVKINIGGSSKKKTLSELYHYYNVSCQDTSKVRIRSFKGESEGIRLHEFNAVLKKGIKSCLTLTLEDGKSISLTYDHKVMTASGFIRANELSIGDSIMVDNLTRHQKKSSRVKIKKPRYTLKKIGEYYPYGHHTNSRGVRVKRAEKHILTYIAHLNRCSLQELIEATYSPDFQYTHTTIDPKVYHVHHLDHNSKNNDISNLKVMTKDEHQKHHGSYRAFGHDVIEYSRVKLILEAGPKEVYDIICEDPHRNFVANGIVVHNSGKTLSTLWLARKQIKKLRDMGVPNPKFMVIIPKSAIPTWKTECASQTPDLLSYMVLVPYSQLHHIVHRVKYADIRMICYDESHYLKSPDTNRIQSLANLLEAIGSVNGKFEYGRVITLTGTPMPNGAHELYTTWALCTSPNLIEAASRLRDEKRFKEWKNTFSQRKERVFMKYSAKHGKKVENSGSTHQGVANEEMLNQLLKEFVHFVRVEDCVDLPEKVSSYIDLNLDDDKLLEDADIDKPEAYMAILERLARAKAPYMFDWVKDFLTAGSEQLIVFSSYTKPIRKLREKFKKDVAIITGAEDDAERAESLLAFQQGKIRVLAMSYRCGSESLNLQNACHTLYHGYPWTKGALNQAMARTYRGGQKHTTFHHFLTSGYHDQRILNIVQRKGEATDKVENLLIQNEQKNNTIINSLDLLL